MKLYTYGNAGRIDKVAKDIGDNLKTFDTIKETLENITDNWGSLFTIKDLSIKYYCYDNRLNHTVYMICTDYCNGENYIEKYGCPQFVSYMIDLEE